jgi:hypothetical protein
MIKQSENQYSRVAKLAYEKVIYEKMTFRDAWNAAANELLSSKTSVQKGCPKASFIGLCESGKLKRIPKTESKESINYQYVKFAIEKWKTEPTISKTEMWNLINLEFQKENSHQGQLDVLIGIWDKLL